MTGELTESALVRLPFFPLPNAVLFPGSLLPLHIFEPRYREMTRDVLSTTRLLAIARLRPGFDAIGEPPAPPVFEVAGVGYIVGCEQLPDGRYNLLLRGVGRVQLMEQPASRSYRLACARRLIDSRSTRPRELHALHQQLTSICDWLAELLPEGGRELRQLVRSGDSPGVCADVLSSALLTDPDTRQRLLETLDPADRVEQVLDHLGRLLMQVGVGTSDLPN